MGRAALDPAPRDEAAAAAVAASSRSDPPFGAVEGPVEIDQAWLAGGGGVDGAGGCDARGGPGGASDVAAVDHIIPRFAPGSRDGGVDGR